MPSSLSALNNNGIPPLVTDRSHTSNFQARQNHPTSYDDSPSFKGPIVLQRATGSTTSEARVRIQNYYRNSNMTLSSSKIRPLSESSTTSVKLKAIVDHLAARDAPVDVKEVTESVEFFLRTRKRLLGAAKGSDKKTKTTTIQVYDLCSGHGLTGMLFAACPPPNQRVETILVDRTEPLSHKVLRNILAEICPWMVPEETVSFQANTPESFVPITDTEKNADAADSTASSRSNIIVISTHACGSLTDQVLQVAVAMNAAGIAAMPCCYTGTDKGTPYGIKRALGVAWAADIRRCFYLAEHGYHADFATIPSEITPMNRILLGENRNSINNNNNNNRK